MITILDLVRAHCGDQDSYSANDHYDAGYEIMGGCAGCQATLASYNAYPTRSGYWSCVDCVPEGEGFDSIEDFTAFYAAATAPERPEYGDPEYHEAIGRQQVYNALLSRYLDARGLSVPFKGGLTLIWAAMATFDLEESEATERVAEDLQERWVARSY